MRQGTADGGVRGWTEDKLGHIRGSILRSQWRAEKTFYTWRRLAWSLATFHRVAGLTPTARYGMLTQQVYFTYSERRGWHPMLGGIWQIRRPLGPRLVKWDGEAAERYLRRPPAGSPPKAYAPLLAAGSAP